MTEIHDEPKDPSTGARDPVERIKSVLDEKLGADAERIDVSVEDDVVILEGSGIAPEGSRQGGPGVTDMAAAIAKAVYRATSLRVGKLGDIR
jgi:hypothetical protein